MSTSDPGQREDAIDALRGLCLLGIAIVNVPWIGFSLALPLQLGLHFEGRELLALPDLIAAGAVEWLAEGKFYPQFAALFGFGASVLMARGAAIYARRIAVLFVLGILHSLFGWWGDILLNYAMLGVVLALFARLPPRGVLVAAVLAYLASTAISLRFDGWFDPAGDALAEGLAGAETDTRVYRDGGFAVITQRRIEELWAFFAQLEWSYRANTVTMGLFGLWVGKAQLLEDLPARRTMLGRTAVGCMVIGLPCALIPQGYIPAGDVLAVGYASLFLWLAARGTTANVVRLLAPLGRMAVSAYLGQTLAFTLFFYGYGLAMYGRVSPWQGVVVSVTVWLVELALAHAWLSRFALGPVEWVWRSLTYARVLPLARREGAAE